MCSAYCKTYMYLGHYNSTEDASIRAPHCQRETNSMKVYITRLYTIDLVQALHTANGGSSTALGPGGLLAAIPDIRRDSTLVP